MLVGGRIYLSISAGPALPHASRIEKVRQEPLGDAHALGILAIDKVESGSATFDLAGQKRKVHPCCSHKIGSNLDPELTYEWLELVQLL